MFEISFFKYSSHENSLSTADFKDSGWKDGILRKITNKLRQELDNSSWNTIISVAEVLNLVSVKTEILNFKVF